MSKVMVWKSDADGKLFEDKAKYTKHLRTLAAERLAQRKIEKMEAGREAFIQQMGQVESVTALNAFIKDNWRWFWANGAQNEFYKWSSNKGKAANFHEYHDVSILNLRWSESLRNSHCSPRKGVQNFDTRSDYNKGKPTGYPGWSGQINIKVKPPMSGHKKNPYMHDGWGSSYFGNTTICTGGGGGGGGGNDFKSYSYEVKLWAADFPVMYEALLKQEWIEQENARRAREWQYLGGKGPVPQVTEIPDDWACPDPLVGTNWL